MFRLVLAIIVSVPVSVSGIRVIARFGVKWVRLRVSVSVTGTT